MSDQSNDGGSRKSVTRIIVVVLIIGAFWGFNRWRFQSDLTSGCKSEMGIGDELCGCFGKEMAGKVNPLAFTPFIGRFLRPGDTESMNMASSAMAACTANSN